MKKDEIDKLLNDENEHLNKLHQIVKASLKEEELIIHNLLNPPLETLTRGQKISDKVAQFGGQLEIYYTIRYRFGALDCLQRGCNRRLQIRPLSIYFNESNSLLHCRLTSTNHYDEPKPTGRKGQTNQRK